SCASWEMNGFCTNAFYSEEIKMQYCCNTCGYNNPAYIIGQSCDDFTVDKYTLTLYCPKSCKDIDCSSSCPAGTTLVGPAVNSACVMGSLFGTICC
ncbi:hypothetical protein PMAYCL1PPCAC_10658, partial [Pristionchus mayeri]